jgi:hypothetical protein
MTMRRRSLVAALLLAASPLALAGGGPYKDLYTPLSRARAADPEHRLDIRYRVRPKNPDVRVADVELKIVAKGVETPLPIGPEGTFELPLDAEWAKSDAELVTNQPKRKLQIDMSVTFATPASAELRYAELMRSVPVMNQALKAYAGLTSLQAPTCRGVRVAFNGTSTQRASWRGPDGEAVIVESRPTPDGTGALIEIERDEKLVALDPKVTLSATPEWVGPLM